MNGYELVRLQPKQVVKTGDTMTGDLTMTAGGKFIGDLEGNASTSTKLQAAKQINGTDFDGSSSITTVRWGAARNISISDADGTNTGAAVSVNGGSNATLKLPATIKGSLNGNADTATKLQTARTIKIGNSPAKPFDGTTDLTFTPQEIGAAGGGGNFLPLTGGTVTGSTTFTQDVKCKSIESTTGDWTITDRGVGIFFTLNSGAFNCESIRQKQGNFMLAANGNATFNEITARGVIYGKNRIALNNGSIYLPQGGGNTTCDHLRMGGGIMACKDDGNFHFLTSNANPTPIYCQNVIASVPFSLKPITKSLNKSNIFDEINSIDVVETEIGLTLVNPTQTLDNKSVDKINDAVFTTVDEKTGDTITNINQNSVIATLWKSNQELIAKIESLEKKIKN